jgi:hypothetical protein
MRLWSFCLISINCFSHFFISFCAVCRLHRLFFNKLFWCKFVNILNSKQGVIKLDKKLFYHLNCQSFTNIKLANKNQIWFIFFIWGMIVCKSTNVIEKTVNNWIVNRFHKKKIVKSFFVLNLNNWMQRIWH